MDNVCNRRLFSIPSKVEMAEEQEYLNLLYFSIFDQNRSMKARYKHQRSAFNCRS